MTSVKYKIQKDRLKSKLYISKGTPTKKASPKACFSTYPIKGFTIHW